MIIANGYIELLLNEAGEPEQDPETGYLTPQTEEQWGRKIKCQYFANNYSNVGVSKEGNSFVVASYTILIEGETVPTSERLKLYSKKEELIGNFIVVQAEPLQAVRQVRITV